jgi:hypothetical protein
MLAALLLFSQRRDGRSRIDLVVLLTGERLATGWDLVVLARLVVAFLASKTKAYRVLGEYYQKA